MYVLGVVGSRDFNNYDLLKSKLNLIIKKLKDRNIEVTHICSGGAKGADKLSEYYANENNLELIIKLPDWNKYNKAAGMIRNKDIWNASNLIVAFWDGISKGTYHTISKCTKQVITIKYKK